MPDVSAVHILDADAAQAVEHETPDRCACQHAQIRPPKHGPQKRLRRAPPDAASLVHLEVAAARVVSAVEDLDWRDAALGCCVTPGVEDLPVDPGIFDPQLAARTIPVHGA